MGVAGNAVGVVVPICGSTVLSAPPLTAPLATESVDIVPTGKVDPGISPGAMLMRLALVPAKPPTKLLAPPVTAPAEVDGSMKPKLAPTKPPT